jgi:glycosyltransferase involved in cell wall biosynthesis
LKISYGITVHNEAEELKRLLNILIEKIDKEDEIIICVDGEDDAVKFELDVFTQTYHKQNLILVYQRKLNGDFASQKNSVIENSKGDYVFHIDADEYPSDGLLEYVKPILEANDIDLIWVPRVNTVDGITEQHIQQWGWRVSEAGWVNYPDYQSRIFKNSPEIRWKSKVHERIHGAQTFSHLPPNETLSLYHPKTIDKQEEQNNFYSKLM